MNWLLFWNEHIINSVSHVPIAGNNLVTLYYIICLNISKMNKIIADNLVQKEI